MNQFPTYEKPVMYRGYRIYMGEHYTADTAFAFTHKDYDGPEDCRAGHARSIDEAKLEIDEQIEAAKVINI